MYSKKSTEGQETPATPATPEISTGMVYEGADAMETDGAPPLYTYIYSAIAAVTAAVFLW